MKEISKEQLVVLDSFKRTPFRIWIKHFIEFLMEKPKDEPLHPKWREIWERIKITSRRYLAPSDIREVEAYIQTIPVIDKAIWDIKVKVGTKVTFLLGAGASAPSGIPTVDKLLSELWNRAKKIGRNDLDNLVKWCRDRGITNIEDLLTSAYISNFVAVNRNITSLLDYFLFSGGEEITEEETVAFGRNIRASKVDVSSISFLQDTLQTLFGLLTSTMISASPNATHNAIVEFIKNHQNTSIITTNYDGCIDEAILKNGMNYRSTIGSESEKKTPYAIQLIKMHGSINWAYCDSCQDAREFDLLKLKEIFNKDILSYPVMGICKNCGGLRRPLLVPPLSFKFLMFPTLIDIWNTANQSIEKADYLIVVGYSFSEADTYITKIISKSMSMRKDQKMIVVNTNRNLVSTLRERFSAHIDGFDKTRILSVCESCDEIMPKFLYSLINQNNSKRKLEPTLKK